MSPNRVMMKRLTRSPDLLGASCAALFFLLHPPAVHAQAPPTRSLPPCDAAAPSSFPCRTPFDKAPMIREQPALPDTGARRSPWVWVFVTEQGTVAAAQVVPSAGIDFDIAALTRAKQLKFSPAQLKGSPVSAWFLVAVETIAAPEGCPTMAVPISAGVATFADSAVLDRPELGTLYRYQGMD